MDENLLLFILYKPILNLIFKVRSLQFDSVDEIVGNSVFSLLSKSHSSSDINSYSE